MIGGSRRRRRRVKLSQRKQFTTRMRGNQKSDWARAATKQQKMNLRSQSGINWGRWEDAGMESYPRRLLLSRAVSELSLIARCSTAVITRNPFFWNVGPASSVYGDLIVHSQLCMRSLKFKVCLGLCSARRLLYFARPGRVSISFPMVNPAGRREVLPRSVDST